MLTHRVRSVAFVSYLFVAVIVSLLAVWIWRGRGPEFMRVVSADGVWTIEGLIPQTLTPEIVRDAAASARPSTAVTGGVYVLTPHEEPFPEPVLLRVNLVRPQGVEPVPMTLGYFDQRTGVWRRVETQQTATEARARTGHFSSWALLKNPTIKVTPADRAALLASARALVQEGRGWRAEISYATVAEDFVVLEDAADGRACPRDPGTEPVRARVERAATVQRDQQPVTGWLRIDVEQFACAETML